MDRNGAALHGTHVEDVYNVSSVRLTVRVRMAFNLWRILAPSSVRQSHWFSSIQTNLMWVWPRGERIHTFCKSFPSSAHKPSERRIKTPSSAFHVEYEIYYYQGVTLSVKPFRNIRWSIMEWGRLGVEKVEGRTHTEASCLTKHLSS